MIKNITLFGFSLLLLFAGCTEDMTDDLLVNQPPQTFLSLYPDSTISQQPSRLTVHWWGDDPDGIVLGYFFSWDGISWTFTSENDSNFSLLIGITDTVYNFQVMAADAEGNKLYDNPLVKNGIDLGPEPFIDENGNGIYDAGEMYYDIGLVDDTPASIEFPIKNSAPEIGFDSSTVLPPASFPVMTFGWMAEDIDGEETIEKIVIALNDTTNTANFVELNGSVRLVTLMATDFTTDTPPVDILINGDIQNVHPEKLNGLRLNDSNRVYIKAVDISGASSGFAAAPSAEVSWFVKKPQGELLVIDDYDIFDTSADFYDDLFGTVNNGALNEKYDVWELSAADIPYFNYNFLLTLNLFDYLFWYSDNSPSLDLAALAINRYLEGGGKVFFSMLMPQSPDPLTLGEFLPIDSTTAPVNFIFPGTELVPDSSNSNALNYPQLVTSQSIARVRSFYPTPELTESIYLFGGGELEGSIGFANSGGNLFYFGLSLHHCNGGDENVAALVEKILFDDFGLVP